MRKNVGVDTSTAGGLITPSGDRMKIGGSNVVLVGDSVADHDDHEGATMETGSDRVFVGGVAVCFEGDTATCGHALELGNPKFSIPGA